ncbi:MAG: hypothetical protein BAJALOKI1v1_430005 [Promethearchaeota archaeon]|nr:MAG: hypothetical protein BAJALOKI1v1_430005 [Candidatus Lokiarchaeota archaeon]
MIIIYYYLKKKDFKEKKDLTLSFSNVLSSILNNQYQKKRDSYFDDRSIPRRYTEYSYA